MPCPTEEQLADFVAGSLSEEARAAVEAHAADCEACAEVLMLFASVYVSDTPETVTLTGAFAGGPEALRPGERIGRFVVLHEVGRGGMGTVHAAYDDALDRRVALKVLAPRRQSEHAEADLRAEARAMAQLVHPNVVTVLDVGIGPRERLFIAMEYVEGGTLRTWLQAGRSVDAVLSVLVDAARGLAAAHRAGFVHRDFKPDNVLVDESGHARVTDFGLARAFDGARVPSAMVGTVPYMAPEQLEGRDAGPVTDVFGWCVTAWEALYGARPFPDDAAARLLAIAEGPPPPPNDRRVRPEIRAALVRGLAEDPADRWPSMEALLEVVAAKRSPGRAVGWGLAAAGVGALALAAIQPFRSESAPRPCLDGDSERARVWPSARRAAFERRYAGGVQRVDAYVEGWMSAIEGHCEAAEAQDTTQAEVALAAECLRLRGTELGEVLGHALDAEPLDDPGRLISGLSAPADCNEPSRYLVAEYRYASPAQREVAQEVDRLLSRAAVASLRGELLEARTLAERAVVEAQKGQREAAWGRALLALADYQTELGDPAAAASLAEALRHATLAGDHGLAFRTVIERMDAIKEDVTSADEMVWLAELARTHAAAEGSPARKEREVMWRLGYVAWRLGQVREAAAIWDDMRALELPDRDGADDIVDGLTVSLLAVSQGRWSGAARAWQAAAEAARMTAPNGGSRLHALYNAAYMTCELGRIAEAEALYADAESLAERRTHGATPLWLDLRIARTRCALNLGLTAQAAEALARAHTLAEDLEVTKEQQRRLAVLELRLSPELEGIDLRFAALREGAEEFGLDTEAERIEFDWGASLLERGRPREARPHLERAHAQSVARVGPGQPVTLARKAWLGVAAARSGDDEALGLLDEALEGLLAEHEGHTEAILQALEARATLEPERAAEHRAQAERLARAWGLTP